jgi:hypothetical protein
MNIEVVFKNVEAFKAAQFITLPQYAYRPTLVVGDKFRPFVCYKHDNGEFLKAELAKHLTGAGVNRKDFCIVAHSTDPSV